MHHHVLQPTMLSAANMPQADDAHREHGRSRLRRHDLIDHRRERAHRSSSRNIKADGAHVLPSLAAATAATAVRPVLGRHRYQTNNTAG